MKTAGYILGAGLLGVVALGSFADSPTPAPAQEASPKGPAVAEVQAAPVKAYSQGTYYSQSEYESAAVPLSNDNYYTNVDGNQVHSPAYAPSVPPGASARCRDGTYSFSQNRRGTCSHHGGVAQWL